MGALYGGQSSADWRWASSWLCMQAISEILQGVLRLRAKVVCCPMERSPSFMFLADDAECFSTGQRVFAAEFGGVAAGRAMMLWGHAEGPRIPFSAAMKLMKWYPLLTLTDVYFHGFTSCSESKLRRWSVQGYVPPSWTGPVSGKRVGDRDDGLNGSGLCKCGPVCGQMAR